MVRLGGIIGVYQEADYFPYALKQAEQMYDEIIIFEGCHSAGHPVRSTDGTVEMVEKSGHTVYFPENTEGERYDRFQCGLWTKGVNEVVRRGCDWFRFHDVDMYFFDKDVESLKNAMDAGGKDCVLFNERRFVFNWKINTHDITGFFYRITPGMSMTPISRIHDKDGRIVRNEPSMCVQSNVCCYHFTSAKKLARMRFRFRISQEKGTPDIPEMWGRYSNYDVNSKLDKDEIEALVGGFGANIYTGDFPEVLKDHPYRFANDIRSIE